MWLWVVRAWAVDCTESTVGVLDATDQSNDELDAQTEAVDTVMDVH